MDDSSATPTSFSAQQPANRAWPRVSVVIPTFNRSAMIGDAIQSVLDQEYPNLEIIVVDDGSTDDTENVVNGFGTRAHYVRQPNGGASQARNRGIALATGELVAFLDSDDLFLPGKILKQVQYFRHHPETILLYSWFSAVDETGRSRLGRRSRLSGCVYPRILGECMKGPLATPTVVALRAALLQAGGFDESMRLSEDTDLWCRLARLGEFGFIPETQVQVRRHSGNLSRGPGRRAYLAAALRIIEKAAAADPELGLVYRLKLRAKARLWSWLVGLGGLLPTGLSFWMRALWTNPQDTLYRIAGRGKSVAMDEALNDSNVHGRRRAA